MSKQAFFFCILSKAKIEEAFAPLDDCVCVRSYVSQTKAIHPVAHTIDQWRLEK